MHTLGMRPVYGQWASSRLYIRCELAIASPKYGQKLGAQRRTGLTNFIVRLVRPACVHPVWQGLNNEVSIDLLKASGWPKKVKPPFWGGSKPIRVRVNRCTALHRKSVSQLHKKRHLPQCLPATRHRWARHALTSVRQTRFTYPWGIKG